MQQVTAEAQDGQQYKTCRVILVTPGISDSVIKIFPAEHDTEKIWLDNTQHIERWDAIQRAMQNYARRGTAVGKPVRYHSDNRDLRTISITEEDIPTVTLDGVVIKAPPATTVSAEDLSKLNPANVDITRRVEGLEGKLSKILDLLERNQPAPAAPIKQVNEAAAAPVSAADSFTCAECGNDFKSKQLLKMHIGKSHKKAKEA